jgi:hypothetical protein
MPSDAEADQFAVIDITREGEEKSRDLGAFF